VQTLNRDPRAGAPGARRRRGRAGAADGGSRELLQQHIDAVEITALVAAEQRDVLADGPDQDAVGRQLAGLLDQPSFGAAPARSQQERRFAARLLFGNHRQFHAGDLPDEALQLLGGIIHRRALVVRRHNHIAAVALVDDDGRLGLERSHGHECDQDCGAAFHHQLRCVTLPIGESLMVYFQHMPGETISLRA
jgi:hypothetical protein